MTPIPFHRFADIFPLMEAGELRDFAEDIRLNGLRRPIELLDRAVLDGRNRHNALALLIESGAPRGPGWGAYEGQPLSADDLDIDGGHPWLQKYNADLNGDPLDYVWSLNFARRHLTASQRAACAAEYDGYRQGRPRQSAPDGGGDNPANLQVFTAPEAPPAPVPQTRAERAEKLGVSERTLADADKVHERSPELHQAVKAGEVTADVAAALAEKPPEEVKALIAALPRGDDGKLTPDAKREVRKVAAELKQEKNDEKKQRRAERERAQGAMQLAAPNKYGVILADPEWRFEPYSRETGMDRAADNHYATSTLDALIARRTLIDELAADGDVVLGLWITDIANGVKLAEAWGFTVKSYRVWVKDVIEHPIDAATLHALKMPEARYLRVCGAPGPGFWGRSRAELMLIAVRGQPACPAMGTQGENVWFAARPHIEGTNKDQHSAKPEETAHDFFDTHFPSFRKVELNARAARPGWDRWGLEAPKGEGWIGPVPVDPAAAPKFAPADEEAEAPLDEPFDEETGGLPPFPWSATGVDDAEHAAAAQAESDNEAAEAAGQGA